MKIPSRPAVAFAVLCFIFGAAPCKAADDKPQKAPPLAVVRTWGDLVSQKPVVFQPPAPKGQPAPAPLRCKLGISGSTAEHYGGVVLYCLVEGGGDSGDGFGGREAFGPFKISVREPGDTSTAEAGEGPMMRYAKKPGEACLFMKTVPLGATGIYHIQVGELSNDAKKPESTTIAEATVSVPEKHGTLWSPWNDPDKEPDGNGSTDDENFSLMEVANPAGGVAVPNWDGSTAVPIAKIPDAKLPLPQIIPAAADPGIQLSVKGSVLAVKLADDETSIYYPDDRFLTRWWVNGKPVLLKPDAQARRWPRALAAPEIMVKEIRFQMDFHPERLGVKKGDTVGVQLLFCPRGWEYSGPRALADVSKETMQMDEDKPEPWRISRMSNRVDFVYSGDRASAAQTAAR